MGINTCCGLATLAAVLVNKVALHIKGGDYMKTANAPLFLRG